jgi:16S rRNA (uracil1498-N3)-methyltransferase
VAASAQVFVDDLADPEPEPGSAHHLARVLRLRPGEVVVAADGVGRWRLCRYRGEPGRSRGRPTLDVAGPVEHEVPPARPLAVAFAPPKGDRSDWVVQKLTELGIDRMVVLATDRTVVRWEEGRVERALDRLRRVAREAAAQSRRVWLPSVEGVVALADLLVAEPGVVLAQMGSAPPRGPLDVVAVGPEGGWSAAEIALGAPTIGLGPHVLRTETAAVAAGVALGLARAATVSGEAARP